MRKGRRAPRHYESTPRGARFGSGELRFDSGGHLARFGKTAGLLFRENDLVVEGDVEHAAVPLDQLGFEAELVSDFVRQTGGSGKIASRSTVFDGKSMIHPSSPFARII
jgi:hypothetical protein